MGNKSTSSQNKKSIKHQVYQQEQLNKIEKEIKTQHRQASFVSNQNNQLEQEELLSLGAAPGSSVITNGNKGNSSDVRQALQGRDSKSRMCQKISQDIQKISSSENQSRETSFENNKSSFVIQNDRKETSKKEMKKNIIFLENNLSNLIKNENYFAALEKLFEILFLNKKLYGNNSEQVAFAMHRMSSILCLLGRLEEALKYEYESCQIRKLILGSLDINIAKSLIYISKLLWYFKKYVQSFYYILEAYNISEHPINRLQMELKQMIGEVSLEMSNIAHENEHFILSFKLKILAFQSKRAAFLFDESYVDDDLTLLAHEVWNYKQGIFLLQMIPQKKYEIISLNKQTPNKEGDNCASQSQENKCASQVQEDNCPICYIEFKEGDEQKELLCSHIFHSVCIDRWIIKNQKCPMCRKNQDLEEYLKFQQSRLHKIQQDQNEKMQLKLKNLTNQNTQFNDKYNKYRVKGQKDNQVNFNQAINTKLVSLSHQTSQTFIFLKKEIENKEVDIFMQDYNQHFNILPLPSENSNSDSKSRQDENQGSEDPDTQFNNNNSEKMNQQKTDKDAQALILKEVVNNMNSNNNNQQNIRNNEIQENYDVDKHIYDNFDFFVEDDSNKNLYNQLESHIEPDEAEEEQKYQDEQQGQFQYYQNPQQNKTQQNKNQQYSQHTFGRTEKELLAEQLNVCIQASKYFCGDDDIQNLNLEQSVNEEKQDYIFTQYEGIMAQSSDFNNLQEMGNHNYEDSSDDSLEDNFEQSISSQEQSSIFSQVEFEKLSYREKKDQQNLGNNKQQNENEQNDLLQISFGQQDTEYDWQDSIFTDQSSSNIQNQYQINSSVNQNKIQNRYAYFEDTKKNDDQLNKNIKSDVTQIKESSSYKTIEDADVNFEDDRISEISNKCINYSENKSNFYLQNNRQLSNNFNVQSQNNQNSKYVNISSTIHQKNTQQAENLIINAIPVNNIKQNIIPSNKSYYQNDEFDIFDKKTVTKYSQNEKINLFEDDQKENLFDNNYIINNNKYSQMSFL